MTRVLCTALGAEEGPHFSMLQDAGCEVEIVDRALDLWDNRSLAGAAAGFDAIIAGSEPYPAEVIESLPEVRVLARTGVGFDAIDLPACDRQGTVVAITPGVNHHSVAEQAIALLMATARGITEGDHEVRNGVWNRVARPRVMGSTLGILGLGRIGQATAARGLGLGMKVLAFEPHPSAEFIRDHSVELVSLDELLARSDYVSLHCPVLPETSEIMNRETIGQMKPGSVLINTSRGGLVEEPALIAALQSGHLRAAGLDVFAVEPLPQNSPLLTMSNVVLSGHVAGLDQESHRDTYAMSADTILQLRDGRWPADRIRNLAGAESTWKWTRTP